MPPTTMGAMRSASQRQLTELATVYGASPTTGRYTAILRQDLACRLLKPSDIMPATAQARAEFMAQRDFWFDVSFYMPEQCQIDISGIRWQPIAGSFQRNGDGVTDAAARCIVIRQQGTSSF